MNHGNDVGGPAINALLTAITGQAKAYARSKGLDFDIATVSGDHTLVVRTAFNGTWDNAAILDLRSGRFLKGRLHPRTLKLTVAKKQPKNMPTIEIYGLLANGDIPGTNGGRLIVLGSTHIDGGHISLAEVVS